MSIVHLCLMKKLNLRRGKEIKDIPAEAIIRRLTPNYTDRIGFRTSEGVQIVQINDILYCEASGNYSKIYLRNNTSILVSKTLKEVSKHLPTSHFLRAHHSHIVHAPDVIQLNHQLTLSNGKMLPIARSKKSDIQQWFEQRVNIV